MPLMPNFDKNCIIEYILGLMSYLSFGVFLLLSVLTINLKFEDRILLH